jgi:hypothetical protein
MGLGFWPFSPRLARLLIPNIWSFDKGMLCGMSFNG